MPKKKKKKKQHTIARTLDLPLETFYDTGRAALYSFELLVYENHKGVLEYGTDCVRLLSPDGVVRIEGRDLVLIELTEERAQIKGNIFRLEFEEIQ